MSRKLKILTAAILVVISLVAGVVILRKALTWPALPNSPTPLAELIEKSDLIVHAQVVKVDNAGKPAFTTTNRWFQKVIKLVDAERRKFTTAEFDVLDSLKGRASGRILVDYPFSYAHPPPPSTDWTNQTMVTFLYRQRGAYHPVAYSYGTRILNRKDGEQLLRSVAEFVATDTMSKAKREKARAEWFVKLIEDPNKRWDGAASWVNGSSKAGEALAKVPPDLAARVEAVVFRDEPLAQGDDVLLREFAPSQPRRVVARLRKYLQIAAQPIRDGETELPEPWRCYGAMQLLARVAGTSNSFNERLIKSPYPDTSTSKKRRDFIETYLPEIEKRLHESGFLE